MDHDDPEQRIAELERQWSEAKAAAGPTAEPTQRPSLTAADIRKVAFSTPPIGKRGYNEDEVDAFLDRVEAWLLNPSDPSLSAADVRNIAFSKPPIGKRGYNEDEVDAFLERVESEISRIGGAPARTSIGQPPPVVSANDGSTKGRSRGSVWGQLALIAVVGIWLYMFGDLVWDFYGYQVGTATTATDVRCRGDANSDSPNVNCSGTWSVGGQFHEGPIHRVPGNWKSGHPLDVHARGGTAYAAASTGWPLGASLLVFVFAITMSLGGFRALDRRWRRWRTSRR